MSGKKKIPANRPKQPDKHGKVVQPRSITIFCDACVNAPRSSCCPRCPLSAAVKSSQAIIILK